MKSNIEQAMVELRPAAINCGLTGGWLRSCKANI